MGITPEIATSLGMAGGFACLAFAAMGSAAGTGVACMASIGVWKRSYATNRTASFLLLTFMGAAISLYMFPILSFFAILLLIYLRKED